MHPVLCTNTHHDVTDLVNHGMVKNTKTWISWKRNIIFLWNKKILNLCLRWHILRSYRFLAEVTFKRVLYGKNSLFHPLSLCLCVSSGWVLRSNSRFCFYPYLKEDGKTLEQPSMRTLVLRISLIKRLIHNA